MNITQPIFIAGPARCGTTMLAGLLHYHGVWIGRAKVTTAPETNSLLGTENINLKWYLKNLSADASPAEVRQQMLNLVQTEDRWLLKTAQTLIRYKKLNKAFPEAIWLLPWRPLDEIVKSAMRHPGMKKAGEDARYGIAKYHQEIQRRVTQTVKNYRWVPVGAIAKKDPEEAQAVLSHCGLGFDYDTWYKWIKPEMWHGE